MRRKMIKKIRKTIRIVLTLSLAITFVGIVRGTAFAVIGNYKGLSSGKVRILRELGKKRIDYLNAVLPNRAILEQKRISISKVSPSIIKESVQWMKTMIKNEWLPRDIEKRLIALKDVKKLEKRDKFGNVFCEIVGDYLIASYEIKGYHIQIQEDGLSISLLVRLPRDNDLSKDPETFITSCIRQFLNFPPKKVANLTYSLKSIPFMKNRFIYHGVGHPKMYNSQKLIWWDRSTVCTDGSFFFISMQERDGKPSLLQAKPGIPSRF